jgi:hypothetical protein
MHEGSNFFFPNHTVTKGHWSKTPGAIPAPTPINENTRQAVRSAMVGKMRFQLWVMQVSLEYPR